MGRLIGLIVEPKARMLLRAPRSNSVMILLLKSDGAFYAKLTTGGHPRRRLRGAIEPGEQNVAIRKTVGS
jgi:hypothetical protein